MHVRVHVHTHTHTIARAHPSCQTATVEEQLHQRQLSLISLYLRYLFLAFSSSPLSLHTFFFSFGSFPCASPSLFPTQSLSHLCLSLLYLPAREILLQREVMFFVLFSSPISGEFTFLKCRLKGSISQVLLCPPTCKTQSHPPPPPPPNPSDSSSQPASLTDSCLISHKLVLPLTHFLFCFLLLLIPFSPCPLPPSISLWSSHFIFLPTNATQQSLKKCHFCLLLLFCNFSVSILFSWEFIYRWLFFCPQLSDLSVSVSFSMSVSPSLSLTLPCPISLLHFLSFTHN